MKSLACIGYQLVGINAVYRKSALLIFSRGLAVVIIIIAVIAVIRAVILRVIQRMLAHTAISAAGQVGGIAVGADNRAALTVGRRVIFGVGGFPFKISAVAVIKRTVTKFVIAISVVGCAADRAYYYIIIVGERFFAMLTKYTIVFSQEKSLPSHGFKDNRSNYILRF